MNLGFLPLGGLVPLGWVVGSSTAVRTTAILSLIATGIYDINHRLPPGEIPHYLGVPICSQSVGGTWQLLA